MKQKPQDTEDTMQDEYDLKTMRIRRVGPNRKRFGGVLIGLAPDAAPASDNASSVKESEAIKSGSVVRAASR